jgi:hypothetical protein
VFKRIKIQENKRKERGRDDCDWFSTIQNVFFVKELVKLY